METGGYIPRMDIHQRIKARREKLKIGLQEFARKMEVTYQAVQQWESEGGTTPRPKRLQKIADVLKTTPEQLMFGPDEESNHAASEPPPDLRSMQIDEIHKIIDTLDNGELATCLGDLYKQYGDRIKKKEDQSSEKVNRHTQSESGTMLVNPPDEGGRPRMPKTVHVKTLVTGDNTHGVKRAKQQGKRHQPGRTPKGKKTE